NRVGRGGGGSQAQQHAEGGVRIHVVGERQQQGGSRHTTDTRQEAQRKAHADAAEQEDQPMPIKNDQQGISCRMKHVHFHDRSSLESFFDSGYATPPFGHGRIVGPWPPRQPRLCRGGGTIRRSGSS